MDTGFQMKKTDTRSAIPLLPAATQLIKKYSNHSLCINKDMPLPVPINQKMNGYLKEIAAMCGIDKILTSHIARHICHNNYIKQWRTH